MDSTQLTIRRQGIGGSDVAAICGLSRWGTPMDVYMDKTGMLPVSSPSQEKQYQTEGKILEDAIAQLLEIDTGLTLIKPEYPGIFRRKDEPWRMGSPDRLVKNSKDGAEIKKVDYSEAHAWGDGPEDVSADCFIQSHWYMDIFDAERWHVGALIGGRFRSYCLPRSRPFEAMLVDTARSFRDQHILPQIPPPIEVNESSETYLARFYQQRAKTLLAPTAAITAAAMEWKTISAQEEALALRKRELRLQIREFIGEQGGILSPDETWKFVRTVTASREKIDWEAVALALHPTPELIAQHTTRTEPYDTIRPYFDLRPKTKKHTVTEEHIHHA